MADRPFREIPVAEIARAADASVSSFYARFRTKEALLGALFQQHTDAQRALFEEVFETDRWSGMSMADVIRIGVPMIVAGYRDRQVLVRAFLDEASRDSRLRETWAAVGDHITARVTEVFVAHTDEVNHPDIPRGVRLCLEIAFATVAHRIQMHEIDQSDMDEVVETMIAMTIGYMGISQ